MALVNVTNLEIQNNPAPFQNPISMQITFECTKTITEEDSIEWILTYVGNANDSKNDIILDRFSMGPLDEGVMQFVLESDAPDHKLIPNKDDLLGITAIILSVTYKQQEFFRVGYYVYNQYTDLELIENDPPEILIDKVQRSILSDKPRITRFQIKWGNESVDQEQQQYNKEVQECLNDPNEQNIQFYMNSNQNSQQLLQNNENSQSQPLPEQNQGANNGQNSVSFGMFDNQNTLKEVSNHFLQQKQTTGEFQQPLKKDFSENNNQSNPFQQQSMF